MCRVFNKRAQRSDSTTHRQATSATDTANNNPYTTHVNNNNNYYYKSRAKIKVTKARAQGGAMARAIHTRARRRLRSAIDGRESRSHMSDTIVIECQEKGTKILTDDWQS